MSAPSIRNMDRAVDERQAVIEASLPKHVTSNGLETQVQAAVTLCRQPVQFAAAIRQGVEMYCEAVAKLAAMYAAEIEHRKELQS